MIPLSLNSQPYGEVQNGALYGPGANGVLDAAGMQGFAQAGKNHKRRVNEAMRLYCDAIQGKVDPLMLREAIHPRTPDIVNELAQRYPGIYGDPGGRMVGLRETMSVTDYQALYVDVLDRLYYGYYNDYPITNMGLVRQHTLRDFRLVSRYLLDGIVGPVTAVDPAAPPQQRALSGPVPQDGATYPTTNTAPIQYQPLLYHVMASINWRAFVNDDLGIFKDVAKRLAMSMRMSLAKFITTFYTDSNGPNATLYKAGYNNIINQANGASVNNPPLGAQGLMDAMKVLARQKDSAGNPILVTGRLKLWFGPSLIAVANNLQKSIDLQVAVEGGSQNAQGFPTQFLRTNPDWLMSNIDLVLDPWIPIVCTTTGVQNTMWGLTVDPESVDRPATEIGLLQGFETAQLFSRVPNTQRMGGGVDAMMGDFNSLDQDIKAMQVWGGTNIDGRTTVASTGQSV
jgi:hypothetical protein